MTVEEIFVLYSGEYGNDSHCSSLVTKVMCHINFLADEPSCYMKVILIYEVKIFQVEIVTLVMR
jgi:hypothetical protein